MLHFLLLWQSVPANVQEVALQPLLVELDVALTELCELCDARQVLQ